jgi:alpha-1,2-mannosyltransferase
VKRAAAVLFLLLCAAWYWHVNIARQLPTPAHSDLEWYYQAAGHVIHGESPYLAPYLYPPLLACLLTPLALCDYLTARWIWFVFSHACLLAAAWLMWRRTGRDWSSACLIALIWAGGGAAGESLGQGQLGPGLALLVALVYASGGRSALQGAWIGAGCAVKLIPGILGVMLALGRQWRALAAAILVGAVLVAVPWIVLLAFLSGPRTPLHKDYLAGTPAVLSWSLPSVALRIFEAPRSGGGLPYNWVHGHDLHVLQLPRREQLISEAAAAAALLAGVAALAIVARGRLSEKQMPLATAALVVLGLLVSPVSWTHYQVINYPGVAYFLWRVSRLRLWKLFAAALACAGCLYPVPVEVLRAYYWGNGGAWPDSAAVMYFWTSLSPAAATVLFGLMLRELKRA